MDDIQIKEQLLLGNKVDCPIITDDGYKTFGRKIDIDVKKEIKDDACIYRHKILKNTLEEFVKKDTNGISNLEKYTNKSIDNVVEWSKSKSSIHKKVEIFSGDWGEITLDVTRKYGNIYAVLNMANAYTVGGGYVEGMSAQEENMWRRSSCHFYAPKAYDDKKTNLINGVKGLVELDMKPRVCIKGQEDQGIVNSLPTGYELLKDTEYFPFWELKAAADDLRNDPKPNKPYDNDSMDRKIKAQFDTMKQNKVRHCVLSAFGCGAFGNPSIFVAPLYKKHILEYINDFDHIVFAIYDYNRTTNYDVFKKNILTTEYYIDLGLNNAKFDDFKKFIKTTNSSDLSYNLLLYGDETKKNIEIIKKNTILDRCAGSIMSMVIADGFGHATEFVPPNNLVNKKEETITYSDIIVKLKNGLLDIDKMNDNIGRFKLKKGHWTDDSSMGLCLLDSLLENNNFVPKDCMLRFILWWHKGLNNSFYKFKYGTDNKDNSCGLGGNITVSFIKFLVNPIEFTTAGDINTSGNGSIMRLCPVAIRYYNNINLAIEVAYKQSKVTHQGFEAAYCCIVMVYILCKLIKRTDTKKIKDCIDEYIQEIIKKDRLFVIKDFTFNQEMKDNVIKLLNCQEIEYKNDKQQKFKISNWKNSTYTYSDTTNGYIGSYCMECLAMALHICYNYGHDYNNAILRITSMGGDADSVGSVVGQILGAYHGFKNIPEKWCEPVFQHDGGSILYRTIKLYEYTTDVKGNKEFIKHVQLMLQHKILKNLYYLQLYDNTNDVLKHKLNEMYDHINTLNMSGGKYHNMYIKNKEKYIELDKNWYKTYVHNKQNYLNFVNSKNY
jgi:ADP-ribosylglycohydrolase